VVASGREVWGYARPSPAQPVARQVEVLLTAGVPPERLLVDDDPVRKHRPQLRGFHDDVLSGKVPAGSVLAVAMLDRLGLTIRETSRLVRELHEHGVGVRTLADVLDLGTTPSLTAAAELALAVLGLVEDAEATYARERVELSRAIAAGKGQQLGRARQVDPLTLTEALRLHDDGVPVAEIEQRMNITRSAFYRLAARERGGPVGVRRRRRPGLPEETRAGLLNLKGQMSMRRAAAYTGCPSARCTACGASRPIRRHDQHKAARRPRLLAHRDRRITRAAHTAPSPRYLRLRCGSARLEGAATASLDASSRHNPCHDRVDTKQGRAPPKGTVGNSALACVGLVRSSLRSPSRSSPRFSRRR
jgi:DNA invertase Pin-like site-specific DNA recombinase